MSTLREDAFRELLDERGLLRPSAPASPDAERAYSVFSQRPSLQLDLDGIRRQAAQFFGTKLGLTVDKRYIGIMPEVDAARIVVASGDPEASGTRTCFGRATQGSDVQAAEEAERAMGTFGLALLARRCPTIWTVEEEAEGDRAALTIATILASTFLGPIVTPDRREIFGVRSARLKLDGRPSPYR